MPVSFFSVAPRPEPAGASETGIACRQRSAYSGTGTSCRRSDLGRLLSNRGHLLTQQPGHHAIDQTRCQLPQHRHRHLQGDAVSRLARAKVIAQRQPRPVQIEVIGKLRHPFGIEIGRLQVLHAHVQDLGALGRQAAQPRLQLQRHCRRPPGSGWRRNRRSPLHRPACRAAGTWPPYPAVRRSARDCGARTARACSYRPRSGHGG